METAPAVKARAAKGHSPELGEVFSPTLRIVFNFMDLNGVQRVVQSGASLVTGSSRAKKYAGHRPGSLREKVACSPVPVTGPTQPAIRS